MEETQPTFNPETGVMTFPPGFSFSHHTEETKEKLREMNRLGLIGRRGQHNSPEHNARISASNKIAYSTPERKAMLSNRACYKTPEHRQKMSELRKATLEKKRGTPERAAEIRAWKEKIDKWIEEHGYPHTGFKATEEQRRNMSKAHKRKWSDPEYAKMAYDKMAAQSQVKPTEPELKVEALLNYYCPSEYEYAGDGTGFIGGVCPDFISCNGKRKVIEVFGDYWHRGEDPQDRIDAFAKLGFKCLVIWEHETRVIKWNRPVGITLLLPLIDKILEFNRENSYV